MRRCCVKFQCRGVLLIWIIVGQGPIALAIGAGGGCLDIFSLIYHIYFFLSPSLGDGPIWIEILSQTTNQPSPHTCIKSLKMYMIRVENDLSEAYSSN